MTRMAPSVRLNVSCQSRRTVNSRRRGSTLTELLMALMVMSIGVISLATLFPISALRVAEATHMTNSTILRHQAEGLMDALPPMAFDPDGTPATSHNGSSYVVDPLGVWNLGTQLSLPLNDPTLTRYEYNRPSVVTRPLLGVQTRYLGEDASAPGLFSNLEVTRELTSLPDTMTLVAEATVADPFTSVTSNPNTLTFPTTDGMDALGASITATLALASPPADAGWRVTLFDATGRFSEIKTVSVDAANAGGSATVTFDEPLSAKLTAAGVGLVRLELVDDFYTFMYSVRNSAGNINVDIVVFFKRDFSELSQQLYVGDLRRFDLGAGMPPTPGRDGIDDNGDGIIDDVREIGAPGSDDTENSSVIVNWDPSLYSADVEKPVLRRGGYIFDPANGFWYRIQAVASADVNGDGISDDTAATLQLDTTIHRDNTEDLNATDSIDLPGEDRNGDGIVDKGGVVIPRGVIAVFPLRSRRLD